MTDIFFCPVEKIENRYTVQWWEWFERGFRDEKKTFRTFGSEEYAVIETGEFNDDFGNNIYKLRQMEDVLHALKKDCPKTIFFLDCWNPLITTLAYVRDSMGFNFQIKGCIHDGTWDKWDYTTRKGMRPWARHLELSILKSMDSIYCATEYHRDMIEMYFSNFIDNRELNLQVVDWPVHHPTAVKRQKKNLVIFPHRIAPEKRPEQWEQIKNLFNELYPDLYDVEWVRTVDVCEDKQEFYGYLQDAKVVVSTAEQETFGIAMAEGVVRGCRPVVPNRISYAELYPEQYKYESLEQAVHMIADGIKRYRPPTDVVFESSFNWLGRI